MNHKTDVFTVAKVCMDSYKAKFDKAGERKKQRFDTLKKNFVPGSPMFVQERDGIEPEYKKEIESARDEALRAFEETLEQTIASEKAYATVISTESTRLMSILDCLKESPVSVDEYQALVEAYGGKSYWTDRFFERIAEKNGIYETNVQPSLTAKLEILNELAANTRDCLNDYDGEHKTFLVTSSDKFIFGLEEKYTNGYSGMRMSDKETAKRLIDKALNKGDSMERSCALANTLRTSKPDLRHEILSLLMDGEYTALSDPTMSITGVKDIVDRFRKDNLQDIKAADVAIQKIKDAKSRQEYSGIIYDNLDNRHFAKEMEQLIKDTNSQELKDCYENMQEIKKEQETSTQNGKER